MSNLKNTFNLIGNLGNILFQLAHQLSYNKDTIFNTLPQQAQIVYDIKKYTKIKFRTKFSKYKIDNNYNFYQSEKYFDINFVRNNFVFNDLVINKFNYIRNKIINENFVGITCRRGDYITLNSIWRYMQAEYYTNMYNKYFNNSNILVSSDDINWCKQNLNFKNKCIYVEDITNNILEKLYLLSLCKHHIGSCSTFSYWCSWLNEQKDSVNIFPKYWFNKNSRQLHNNELDIENNIIPSRWYKDE